MEQEGESRGEGRQWGGNTRLESQGNIGLHLVCHGERATAEVVTQNQEERHTRMSLPPRDQEQPEQSGEHLVEGCRILAEARELVERNEMREWRTRHSRNQLKDKKKKGPVEPEKEKEEDKLERFFCHLYELHNPVPNAPVFVPAELPPLYAIDFVPAASALPVSPKPVVPDVPGSVVVIPVFPIG